MAFSEPFRGFLGFELEIVVSSTYFHLNILDFGGMGLGFGDLLLLLFVVLKFTIIHDFCNRRGGIWRDFDEIRPAGLCFLHGLVKSNNPEVFSIGGDDTELG